MITQSWAVIVICLVFGTAVAILGIRLMSRRPVIVKIISFVIAAIGSLVFTVGIVNALRLLGFIH
jgi:hypothetical protein